MPSLLDVLVERGLHSRSDIRRVDGGVEINVEGIVKRIDFSCPEPDEDLSRFHIWCTAPTISPESAVREIKDRESDGRTLGYIFPITSFAPDSDYAAHRLSGRYEKIFSSVAAIAVAMQGVANSRINRSFAEIPDELPLRELFPEQLAIAVVGRENLRNVGTSEAAVRLLVQEAGYFAADLPKEYIWARPSPQRDVPICSIGRVAQAVLSECPLFERLVCLAAAQSSAVASMLIYYQVVEVLAERVLHARLSRLSASPPTGSWAFKEALRDAVSESSRVTSLCSQAGVGNDAAAFTEVQRIGADILRDAGEKADGGPGAILYAVRNLVVHNQVALTTKNHELLNGFVHAMHSAIFAMIRRFDALTAN